MAYKFTYTAKDVDCKYCLHGPKGRCKFPMSCPYTAERIEAGVLNYDSVLRTTFPATGSAFTARIRFLSENFKGSLWNDTYHEQRFDRLCSLAGLRRDSKKKTVFAVLYLLSSSGDCFNRSLVCIFTQGIDLSRFRLDGILPEHYGIVQAAKTLLNSDAKITLWDLRDSEVVDTESFRLIIHAMLIARYGRAVTDLRE